MYTPGHATAKFLSRQVICPCCDGKGFYEVAHSADGFNVTGSQRHICDNCHQGRINWMDYKKSFEWQFGAARFA